MGSVRPHLFRVLNSSHYFKDLAGVIADRLIVPPNHKFSIKNKPTNVMVMRVFNVTRSWFEDISFDPTIAI